MNLEDILKKDPKIGSLISFKALGKRIEEDAWDPEAKGALGQMLYGDYRALAGDKGYPDAVKDLYNRKKEQLIEEIQKEKSYSELVNKFDAESLKFILEELPALNEDKKYKDLAKKHSTYQNIKSLLEQSDMVMNRDPEKFRDQTSESVEDLKKYHAASSVSAAKVATGLPGAYLESKRQLYEAIDRLYKKK